MNTVIQNPAPTFESVWATIQESNRYITEKHAETDLLLKENAKQQKETDLLFKETGKKIAILEKMVNTSFQQIGGISQSNGAFCEEYFINAFKANPTFFGEKFDIVVAHLKPYPNMVIDDEYDLILHNGKTVVLIEMKYKACVDDVGKMFKKLESYRANYPMNEKYKIYLCLASFSFSNAVKAHAEKRGIVLIEHRGEKIEVVSKNLKTW